MEIPEVVSVGRRTGRAELDEHAQGVETSEIDVRLKPSRRSRADIVRDIRDRLAVLPVTLNIGQPISHRIDHLLSGVRAEVVGKVFGDDLDNAGAVAAWLHDELAALPGLVDLQVERHARVPVIEVDADARRAALYGVTPQAPGDAGAAPAGGRRGSQGMEGAQAAQ